MKMLRAAVSVGLVACVFAACSGDDSGPVTTGGVCEPDAVRECAGPLGCLGLETCSSRGEAWSDCDCGIDVGIGGSLGTGGATSGTGGSGGSSGSGGGGAAGGAGMPPEGGAAGQAGEGGEGGTP